MKTNRGLDRLPEEFRELFWYKDGRLRAKCKNCPNTRQTRGMNHILKLISEGTFTGLCKSCELSNLSRVDLLSEKEVNNMNVNFDWDSQRREGPHIVIDKVCLDCTNRVTVRVASVKATLRSGGNIEGRCTSCAKPGWYMNSGGYILERVPDHPYASKDGYVFQHRIVKETELGRYLDRSETVHHKDGNRANNHPSNLELRQGNHGAGVKYQCQDCKSHNVLPVDIG
jgi:hypothetical protein